MSGPYQKPIEIEVDRTRSHEHCSAQLLASIVLYSASAACRWLYDDDRGACARMVVQHGRRAPVLSTVRYQTVIPSCITTSQPQLDHYERRLTSLISQDGTVLQPCVTMIWRIHRPLLLRIEVSIQLAKVVGDLTKATTRVVGRRGLWFLGRFDRCGCHPERKSHFPPPRIGTA